MDTLCACFAERGLPATGRLSVEAIRAKAYTYLCESETDLSFAQASSAIQQYADLVMGLYEKLPRP